MLKNARIMHGTARQAHSRSVPLLERLGELEFNLVVASCRCAPPGSQCLPSREASQGITGAGTSPTAPMRATAGEVRMAANRCLAHLVITQVAGTSARAARHGVTDFKKIITWYGVTPRDLIAASLSKMICVQPYTLTLCTKTLHTCLSPLQHAWPLSD